MQSPTPDPAERPSPAAGDPAEPSSAASPAAAEPAAVSAPQSRPAYPPAVLAEPVTTPAAPVHTTPLAGTQSAAPQRTQTPSASGDARPATAPAEAGQTGAVSDVSPEAAASPEATASEAVASPESAASEAVASPAAASVSVAPAVSVAPGTAPGEGVNTAGAAGPAAAGAGPAAADARGAGPGVAGVAGVAGSAAAGAGSGAPGGAVDPGCGPAVEAQLRQQPILMPTPPAPPVTPTPPAAARGPRPATVTVAVILQYVVAGLLVAMVGLLVWEGVTYGLLIDEAADTPGASQFDADAERVGNWSMNGLAIALLVLLAGWLVTNTLLTARGNNVTRILNLAGLGAALGLVVLGACSGGLVSALPFSTTGYGASDPFAEYPLEEDPFLEEAPPTTDGGYYHENAFYDRLADLVTERNSVAFDVGMPLLGVVAVFLAITVMVLLLVPPTNRWFNPGRPAGPRPGPQPWPPHAAYGGPVSVAPFAMQPVPPQPFTVPHFPPQPNPYPPVPHYPVPPQNTAPPQNTVPPQHPMTFQHQPAPQDVQAPQNFPPVQRHPVPQQYPVPQHPEFPVQPPFTPGQQQYPGNFPPQ
ncbi:hypothetical protein J2S43_003870 [Catenuloplanes nepalensis]|uniref:Uncharacterized protein n=1 Tax=Catenuloplanes nepalensis TaxID=587533 RepID=A0ABT9MVA3_9ACTN|nr:hypothetical protein [Catenuloplanes nepalensis]MDP9795358.1 hypothetical protein [Catenuloplanes nepalensis]